VATVVNGKLLFLYGLYTCYILILGFTIVIDYFAGILLENTHGRKRKIWLIASIIAKRVFWQYLSIIIF
jgi:phage-related holin